MAADSRRIVLAHITTIPLTQWAFLRGQNHYMSQRGFEIHTIASPGKRLAEVGRRDGAVTHSIRISRTISPCADIISIIRLLFCLREIKPDIVHLSTPKAALLGAIAAWAARVPIRIFFVRGLITETTRGLRRGVFRLLETLTARLCHQHICVSHSLLAFARSESILTEKQGIVLVNGMSNGIDTGRFDPTITAHNEAVLNTADEDILIIGFVGRLARDKGIEELAQSWGLLREEYPHLRLLLVGPWETEIANDLSAGLESDSRVWMTGFVDDVIPYYCAMSLFVYPSHGTEGFPNSPMEAAAMGLPVVASRVVGCVDAVQDGVTGALIPPHDPTALTDAIRLYLNNPDLRHRHGQAGRERVLREFRQETIWEALYQEYVCLLRERGLPIPESASDG